jgi:adenylate kinase
MKPVYIFIGIPGSGKDTQAKLLAQKLKLPHVDAGSTFREIIQKKLKYWEYIEQTYTHSLPIPSDMFFKIMAEKFMSEDCSRGFILSQNTKSVEEATDLQKLLNELGFELKHVYYLTLDRDEAVRRAIKRLDGKFTEKEPDEATLVKRIDNYVQIVPTIVDYYRGLGVLVEIDGTQSVETIAQQVEQRA